MTAFGPCAICSQYTTNWCSRCQNRFYCSAEHLQADWPQHRFSCVAIAAPVPALPDPQSSYSPYPQSSYPPYPQSSSSSYPSYPSQNAATQQVYPIPQMPTPASPTEPIESFRAIYFPKDEESLRLVNVDCMPPSHPDSAPEPVVSPFLRTSDSGGQKPLSFVLTQGVLSRLVRPLQVWYCPGSTTENRAILDMMSKAQAPRSWKGDVIVMKYRGTRRRGYVHATHADASDLMAFLKNQK